MLASAATAAPQNNHNLPVLFQFSQPGHNVAAFRGAELKKAIASGLVSGFGNLGGENSGTYDADAKLLLMPRLLLMQDLLLMRGLLLMQKLLLMQ